MAFCSLEIAGLRTGPDFPRKQVSFEIPLNATEDVPGPGALGLIQKRKLRSMHRKSFPVHEHAMPAPRIDRPAISMPNLATRVSLGVAHHPLQPKCSASGLREMSFRNSSMPLLRRLEPHTPRGIALHRPLPSWLGTHPGGINSTFSPRSCRETSHLATPA
jgi:hypothetical protein